MRHTITILLVLVSIKVSAQLDPLYQQYHLNQYLINPAYGGIYKSTTFSVNSRLQWLGLEGSPFTNTFTTVTNIGNFAGFGVRVMSDQIGIRKTNELVASTSYFIRADKITIGFGLQGGINQTTNDLSEFIPEVLHDPTLDNFIPSFIFPTFGAGIMIKHSNYFFGFSIPRLLNEIDPRLGYQDNHVYKRHYYVSAGFIPNLIDMKLQTLVRIIGNKVSVDVSSTYFVTENLWAGVLFRDVFNIGVFGQLQVKDRFRLGYTIELPFDDLITTHYGTHEVTLSYSIAPGKRQSLGDRFF